MIDLRSNFRIILGIALALVVMVVAVGCEAPWSEPAGAGAEDGTHRVFVVHSYSTAFPWTKDLHEGIINGLSESGLNLDRDYQLQTFYMDTRVNFTTPERIQERAAEALEALQEFMPDILFVTDDVALEHVAVKYAEQNPGEPLATVFAGVNIDPTIYAPISSLDVPGGSITGALERIPYSEAFATAQRLFPDAANVVIIGDAGTATQSARAAFMHGDQSADFGPIEVLDFLLFEEFEQWKSAVIEYQDEADLIAILNFHQLRDAEGAVVPPSEVIDWMEVNSSLPELGLLADWARDGLLVAVGNSGIKTGAYVGTLGADILNGADPATTPIVDPKQTDVNFNLARARSLGIELAPEDVEAADMAFETMGGR